jgi:hypothetical protein
MAEIDDGTYTTQELKVEQEKLFVLLALEGEGAAEAFARKQYFDTIDKIDKARCARLGMEWDLFCMIARGGKYKELVKPHNFERIKKHYRDPRIMQLVAEQAPFSIVDLVRPKKISNPNVLSEYQRNYIKRLQDDKVI